MKILKDEDDVIYRTGPGGAVEVLKSSRKYFCMH